MPKAQSKSQRWYPSQAQLKDPSALERSFRQLLTQHYNLQDRFAELHAKVHASPSVGEKTGPPPGSGPTDTQLCGLYVQPVDAATLANGATLKWNKASGNFSFQ